MQTYEFWFLSFASFGCASIVANSLQDLRKSLCFFFFAATQLYLVGDGNLYLRKTIEMWTIFGSLPFLGHGHVWLLL
jgi:hypothetical protein